jgi:hypothetical protein
MGSSTIGGDGRIEGEGIAVTSDAFLASFLEGVFWLRSVGEEGYRRSKHTKDFFPFALGIVVVALTSSQDTVTVVESPCLLGEHGGYGRIFRV